MTKLLAMLLAIGLMLGCCAAFAEEEPLAPMPEAAAVYEGQWACGRATIEAVWEEEGFRVLITWGNSADSTTQWEYNCFYNEADHTLSSVLDNGIKTDIVFNANGDEESVTQVYENGEASFSLDENGHLIWKDAKEDAGKDMLFEYVGPINMDLG